MSLASGDYWHGSDTAFSVAIVMEKTDHNSGTGYGDGLFVQVYNNTTNGSWSVGQRVGLRPSHIDPTISKHESLFLVEEIEESLETELLETLEIDLRGW